MNYIPIGNQSLLYALSVIIMLIHWTNSTLSSNLNIFIPTDDFDTGLTEIPAEKRYAFVSYNYGSRRQYGRRQKNDYFRKRYRSFMRPWERLPDTRCYRQRCSRSSDCCRRHNICDPYIRVCYDCWYGYRCKSAGDCCERYPYCHPVKKICYN